jgi:hypothetical protein
MYLEHRWQKSLEQAFLLGTTYSATKAGWNNFWDRTWSFYEWVMWAPVHHVGHRILRILALGICFIAVPLLSPIMLVILAVAPIFEVVARANRSVGRDRSRQQAESPVVRSVESDCLAGGGRIGTRATV